MKTQHKIIFQNAKQMDALPSESVDLVVTSPPYPMIEMWDKIFSGLNSTIKDALDRSAGMEAFELMHQQLDLVWDEVFRVLKYGRFACINIGDATRTINGDFKLYTSHSRIQSYLQQLGFSSLPAILWRKQTNAPNKFMGSGMLPAGAYVTLEHEYILIARKGSKRVFDKPNEKQIRRESAFFWEERNTWFSDIWFDIKGTQQELGNKDTRSRSAAYPFELAYRLINMYAAKGDLVLDPFFGIGTTMAAAMASGRNSIGFEIDPTLKETIQSIPNSIIDFSNEYIQNRIERHILFSSERMREKGPLKYANKHYGFPVVTAQEKELLLNVLISVKTTGDSEFEVLYADEPQPVFCKDWEAEFAKLEKNLNLTNNNSSKRERASLRKEGVRSSQMGLFQE
jgi:DNA modification methylase